MITFAPIFVSLNETPRATSIEASKTASQCKENAANNGSSPSHGVVRSLMGIHSFNAFWINGKRWMSVMTDYSIVIVNGVKIPKHGVYPIFTTESLWTQRKVPVHVRAPFLKRSRSTVKQKPSLRIRSTLISPHSWLTIIYDFVEHPLEPRLAVSRKEFHALKSFLIFRKRPAYSLCRKFWRLRPSCACLENKSAWKNTKTSKGNDGRATLTSPSSAPSSTCPRSWDVDTIN